VTVTPSVTASISITPSQTVSLTAQVTPSAAATNTPANTPTPSITVTSSLTPTPSITPSQLLSGPIAYYKFDEGTGTATADATGHGNTGTTVNGVTWTTGQYASALNFNGNNSYVSVVNNLNDLDNLEKNGGMTVVAWINPTTSGVGGAGRIVDKDDNDGGWFLAMKGTNQIQFVGDEFATKAMTIVSTDTVTLGSWNHVAVTWDGNATGTNCNIYINGILSSTTITAGSGASGSDAGFPFIIGNRASADRGFLGGIEEVAVWSRMLNVTDINTFMRVTPPPTITPSVSNSPTPSKSMTPTPSSSPSSILNGPVAYYSFDEGSGTVANDSTIYNNTATWSNSALWVTGKSGNAINLQKNTGVLAANGSGSLANLNLVGMSIATWIFPRTSGAGGAGRILDKDNSQGGWFLAMKGTNQIQFVGDEFATNPLVVISTATLALNAWNHVAVTWDGNADGANCLIYINGVQSATTVTAGSGAPDSDATIPLCIGNRTQDNARGFDGYIDEMYIYNHVISLSQIQSVMNVVDIPPTPTPVVSATVTASVSITPSVSSSSAHVTATQLLSPTPSNTSSQTRTPTISLTPSISTTPSMTRTRTPSTTSGTGQRTRIHPGHRFWLNNPYYPGNQQGEIAAACSTIANNQFNGIGILMTWANISDATLTNGNQTFNIFKTNLQDVLNRVKATTSKKIYITLKFWQGAFYTTHSKTITSQAGNVLTDSAGGLSAGYTQVNINNKTYTVTSSTATTLTLSVNPGNVVGASYLAGKAKAQDGSMWPAWLQNKNPGWVKCFFQTNTNSRGQLDYSNPDVWDALDEMFAGMANIVSQLDTDNRIDIIATADETISAGSDINGTPLFNGPDYDTRLIATHLKAKAAFAGRTIWCPLSYSGEQPDGPAVQNIFTSLQAAYPTGFGYGGPDSPTFGTHGNNALWYTTFLNVITGTGTAGTLGDVRDTCLRIGNTEGPGLLGAGSGWTSQPALTLQQGFDDIMTRKSIAAHGNFPAHTGLGCSVMHWNYQNTAFYKTADQVAIVNANNGFFTPLPPGNWDTSA
jgi:hypothetical protein